MSPPILPAAAAGALPIGDFRVNRLGFGAMRLTGKGIWGPPADRSGALAVLRRAVELGVQLIDTADSYGPDVDEELIAEALHPYPAGVVIATKGGHTRGGPDAWTPNGRPDHLKRALEGSLRRLRLACIDVYQLHRPDPSVRFEESVGALAEMRAAGKIRHVGLSNVTVRQIENARQIVPIVSIQNRFNNGSGGALEFNGVTDDETIEVLDYCTRHDIVFFPWGPLGGGAPASQRIQTVAHARGLEPNQVALAWLLRRSRAIVPIPGTASLVHLAENVAAAAIELSAEDFATLSVADQAAIR